MLHAFRLGCAVSCIQHCYDSEAASLKQHEDEEDEGDEEEEEEEEDEQNKIQKNKKNET